MCTKPLLSHQIFKFKPMMSSWKQFLMLFRLILLPHRAAGRRLSYIQALTMNKPITVLGDLNCNVLKESPERKALSSFLSETNLKQIITTPTRITDSCKPLIDVNLVLSPDLTHARGVTNARGVTAETP